MNIKLTWGSYIFMNWDLLWDIHIGTTSNRDCEKMWFLQWQYYINLIFFYQLIMILEDENRIYLIFYFLHVFIRKLIIVSMPLLIHEILQNSNPFAYHTNQLK